jgi:hypothetical protein
MWEAKNLNFAGWTNRWNFGGYDSGYSIIGDIAKIEMYNGSLSAAQSRQNYFGAPIVTDGLVFAVDANNIVSYPKSGTDVYDLVGSRVTGTLTNGTSFSPPNGGSFIFDGVDDYIVFPDDTNLDNQALTMESWSNVGTFFLDGFLFEKGSVNTKYSNFYTSGGYLYFRTVGLSTWDLIFYCPSYMNPNKWNHIVCTYDSGVKTIYANGVQVAQQTGLTGTIGTNTTGLFLGAYGPGTGYFLNGKIANSRVYNRALTAAEVQQNYQAEQYRFEGPSGLITNGMVMYLDASNLDSYSGTGNTWYDLSGNNNNATKNGNAANPTWNAGGYFTFSASDGSTGANNIFTVANSATLSNLTDITVQFICAMETKTPVGSDYDWMCIVTKGEEGGNQKPGTSVNQLPGNRYYHIETPTGVNSASDLFTNADYTGNKWNMFQTRVSNAGGTQGWLNGTQVSTSGTTTTGNTSTTYIGSNGFFELFKGKMGVVCIYNRALSNAELVQNYNYFKGRFGL